MMRNVLNRRRSRTGCSILALATVLAVGASPAFAQSFQGTGTFSSGTGTITAGGNTTSISVTSPTAVINWIPTDNVVNPNVPIVFQPGGTFADFSGGSNYAVLNKINVADASRVIRLDGTIRTVLVGAQASSNGSIYFYSPSGFLLGGSSVINVGSLVLSALPIMTDGSGNFIAGVDRTVTFGPAVNPSASITVDPGSQITTNLTGSYVAMVAPRVAHHGTITTNGQAALVAAEAATINFSPDGLFDISITTGTTDANGIALHGDINGQASTGVGDNNRIYAVAVPKNDALTMVIGSGADLGFAVAGAANVDGNAIVLSAGHNVTNGVVDELATTATSEAAMVINAPRATSAFTAVASGNVHLFANTGQVSTFASNVTLRGDNQAWASATGAGSSLAIAGNLHLSTDESAAASGGSAQGGETSLYAQSGGIVTVAGTVLLTANAVGGSTESSGQAGGTGTGGLVLVRANDTGSSVTVTGALTAEANGSGGTSFGGNGGAGFGGATANGGGVTISANGGILALNGGATASANGVGGDAYAAGTIAGAGTGGRASIYAINSGVVGVTGNATLSAGGDGGTHWFGGTGGAATGGTAELDTSGSAATQINILGSAYLSAIAAGGDSFNISEGPLGDGGDAFGGKTRAAANQGLIRVTGNLSMDSTLSGGSGATGGDATGITTPSMNEGLPPAAMIWAGLANAEVRVSGLTDIDVSAVGGTGYNGSGGTAGGGEVDIASQQGHVNLGNVVANADAEGGDGGSGGAGGNASGGAIDVSWSVDEGPVTGMISAGTVTLSAIGQGGNGGVGASAATGGSGGAGGSGTGGGVSYVGNAAGGTFNVGATTIVTDGRGGNGGSGGIGTAGVGGTGGAGGSGTGGFIQSGNISFSGNPGSGGTATFTNLSASSGATGGNGGNGGSGSGGAGTGGAGGNATAGEANFLVRGIVVTANTISLAANATGGNGGSGSTAGIGGNAVAGFISAESKDRFDHPDQRGSLTASAINGTAIAIGGTGAVNGTSTVRGGSYFRVLNGDADIDSINFQFSGTAYNGSLGPNYIQAESGTATVDTLSYSTTGDLAIYTTNSGALNVGNLTLSAGNFIDHPTLVGPATPGTISATNLTVTSGGNFFADANLNVTNGIGITVPGSIRFDNATSASFVDLWAQSGSISLDDVSAGGYVSLDAGTTISTGIISGGEIDLDAIGNISFVSASAGSDFDFYSEGSVTGGNVVAVQEISGHANGSVSLGNLTAGPPSEDDASVGITAVGNISVGNVTGASLVGFATQGNLTAGTISAGDLFLAMVGGNFTSGAITTTGETGGQVYIADDSMFATGGGTWDDEGDFDPSIVLALDPVRTGGSITINGAVNTGRFQAAAGTNLTTGAISSGDSIGLDANGSISTGNLVAGNFVLANGGSITTGSIDADSVAMESSGGNITIGGDVTANGLVELDAFGNIVTDNITAGTIELAAGGSVTTDNLTTEIPLVLAAADFQGMPDVDPDGEGNIVVIAGGNILTGDITAAESILLVTPGTITGEEVEAGNIFLALAHGDMVFGNATAAEVFLADFAMYNPGGGGEVSATCNGVCGTLGPDGVVTAPPSGGNYTYVTTAGAPSGGGQLSIGGVNGSDYTTSEFTAAAGDDLEFWFNYVTSDGGGFADYAWASLLTAGLDPVAILFTARTQASGTIVPGFGLPGVEATLDPASVPIIAGGPAWSPLGGNSGSCYSAGCGYTGWVNSKYEIAEAGNYVLRFGVTNWSDSGFDSGMAFSGITIGGVPVESMLTPTGGSITIGNVNAGKMTAAAGTTLTTGIIDVSDFANLVSGGNMVTNAITAGNNLWAESGGTMTLGLLAGGDIELDSVGNMSFVSATADTEFDFSSDGSVNGGNVTAGNQISGDAGGTVTLANLTVGGPPQEGENFSIGITALDDITVGNVSGAGPVGFGTPEDLTTGNVAAGDLFLTLVGGNIAINGSVTTTGEGSQVYMADYSMCETGGGCTDDGEGDDGDDNDFDPSIVLGLDPVMTGGSISIAGPVSTGVFRAAAGTSFIANNISAPGSFSDEEIFAEGINVRAGGLATINGTWAGPDVNVVSNDIDITGTGSVQAGDVEFYSTNATQTVVGDGVGGGGYQLSDAEFDRINVNGELEVGAWVGGGAADRMMFGDLTYTDDSEGGVEIEFAVFEDDSEIGDGSMRVVGDMVFNGMSGDDSVQFTTGLFELDAATGSVSLFSGGTTLGGELQLSADSIHVADGAILDQLASNPTYDGYQQDLNETPTTQRPEGVLRADTLWIESDNLQDILIQNTGTGGQGGVPAGFVVRQAFINEEIDTPPGSVNLIINGQVVTEGGTLTGVAARDALVGDSDTAGATSNSTINGCPLTGPCIIKAEEPPPNPDVVDDQIDLINGNPLGDGDFGNEDSIDDNEEGDEGAENPISPPQPLFDTRPLVPSGDVNDPVSGTGNPALTGGAAECEEGEDGECPAEQSDGEGQ